MVATAVARTEADIETMKTMVAIVTAIISTATKPTTTTTQ